MLDAPGRSDLGWKLDDVLVAGWLGGGVVGRRSEFGQSLGCRHHRRPRSSRDLCAQRLGCCLSASRSLVLVSGLDCVVLCWSSVWGVLLVAECLEFIAVLTVDSICVWLGFVLG